jgi:hypothetical protein
MKTKWLKLMTTRQGQKLERALQGNLIMKSRCTATVNLLFLYLKLGKTDKANELIKSLPHIWESREILMPEVNTSKN